MNRSSANTNASVPLASTNRMPPLWLSSRENCGNSCQLQNTCASKGATSVPVRSSKSVANAPNNYVSGSEHTCEAAVTQCRGRTDVYIPWQTAVSAALRSDKPRMTCISQA